MNAKVAEQPTLYDRVAAIPDPEIPVITIEELGILRSVTEANDGSVSVTITPTYSGCPAMNTIAQDIEHTLADAGIHARVDLVLDPPWTTDAITQEGRNKLLAYGIAPPVSSSALLSSRNSLAVPLFVQPVISCPRCKSTNTRQVSAFGATACKEQWQCDECLEPFEYFKCHR